MRGRACGGDNNRQSENEKGDGQSPRVRGRLEEIMKRNKKIRSIPARAGETTGAEY